MTRLNNILLFFFFNDTATTEIYTLSLHDALPISAHIVSITNDLMKMEGLLPRVAPDRAGISMPRILCQIIQTHPDRKSTRLNSSHSQISYAVFCLKKKTTRI